MRKIGVIDIFEITEDENTKTITNFNYHLYIFQQTNNNYELIRVIKEPHRESFKEAVDYYLSLPITLLNFRILEFPFSDKEKLRKVIPFELDNLIIHSGSKVVFDFKTLNVMEDKNKILVIFVEKNILSSILDKLSPLGIVPYLISSIELSKILREKVDNLAYELISPVEISGEDRIKAVKEELISPIFNLKTGDFAYTKDLEIFLRKLQLTITLIIVLVFVINLILGVRIFTTHRDISLIKNQMRNIYSTTFPEDRKIFDELHQMKSHLKNIKEKADILIGVSPLEHLLKMSEKKINGITIEELNFEREFFTIKGEANSLVNLDELKKNLSEKYQEVSISETKTVAQNKILFTMLIREKVLQK
ncbi:MAG: hypothetical protein N2511_00440 [Thermodesulfovibrionales bacterium]|nr:hypothetical protein [Thermodesulfovibrionales bacterium]